MGGGSDAFHHDRAHSDVGYEVAVHDVNVDIVGASRRHLGHLLSNRAKSAVRMDGANFTALADVVNSLLLDFGCC